MVFIFVRGLNACCHEWWKKLTRPYTVPPRERGLKPTVFIYGKFPWCSSLVNVFFKIFQETLRVCFVMHFSLSGYTEALQCPLPPSPSPPHTPNAETYVHAVKYPISPIFQHSGHSYLGNLCFWGEKTNSSEIFSTDRFLYRLEIFFYRNFITDFNNVNIKIACF